jgi:hypothetical protein
MKYSQNYEIFHLHELEETLDKLDIEAKPDEAAYIKELIAKGGYQYPSAPKSARLLACSIKYRAFKYFLVFTFACSLLDPFLSGFEAANLVSLAFPSVALVSTVIEYKYLKHMLVFWCVVGAISWFGFAIRWYYTPELTITSVEYISFAVYALVIYGTLKWVSIERAVNE